MTMAEQPERPRRRLIVFLPLVVFVALAGLFLARLGDETDRSVVPSALIGRPAPDVALPPVEGVERDGKPLPGITPALFQGKVTVLNVWGSWCAPCRDELPAFQRFAERAAGKVHVIGVDTHDTREAGGSLAEDLGVTYPNLYDRSERFRIKLSGRPLPVTLFIDQQGRIRHLYNAAALDDATLATLAAQHLGVTLP
jgi:DsbE subfamily thiol:disulfide oxidoreductase